jgi:hypothetical protein
MASPVALAESSCTQPFPCGSILVASAPMDYVQVNIGLAPYIANAASNTAGTWRMTNTSAPEPSLVGLSGVLVCLFIYVAGRRRAQEINQGGGVHSHYRQPQSQRSWSKP